MKILRQLIESLSAKEQQAARIFLRKEFSLRSSIEKGIFEEMCKGQETAQIQLKLFEENAANQKKNQGIYRKLCSQLNRRLENFLILQKLEASPLDRQLLVLDIVAKRKLDEAFQHNHKKCDKIIKKELLEGGVTYRQQYRLAGLMHNQQQLSTPTKGTPHLGNLFLTFDTYWLVEKYQHLLAWQHKKRSGQEYKSPPPFLHELLLEPTACGEHFPPITEIELLRDLYIFREGKSELSHKEFTEKVMREAHSISKTARRLFFNSLHADFASHLNEDYSLENLRNLYSWYKWGLAEGLLIVKGKIHSLHYKALIVVTAHLKLFDDAEMYIKELTPYLDESFQSNMEIYVRSICEFKKGNRQDIEKLRNLTYHNSVDEISAGFYLIKFDYEEQNKTLSNDLATVRMRVGRLKNMNKSVIDSFQKRIAVLQTFLKARSVDQKKELREHLLNTPACADTQWVLSQLEKL